MLKRLMFFSIALLLVLSTVLMPQGQVKSAALLAPTGQSYVRVLHAVPGAGAVDVWVGGTKAITNLAFGEISAYQVLTAGADDVQVFPAGAVTGALFTEPATTFTSGLDYTVAARSSGSDVVAEIFSDDNTLPAVGNAHVRFVHLSPDAPAVDVAAVGGTPFFTNISYGEASTYYALPADTYDLEVRPTGTTDVALAVPDVELKSGTVYTVFALGNLAGTPALFAKLVADSGNTRVRVVHASPDAPAVDVYLDGVKVLTNLTYKQVSAYLQVPSGPQHNITVTPTGVLSPKVIDTDLDLQAGQTYTIAAAGKLATIAPVVYMDDTSVPAAGKAHVRFIHLSPDAAAVDIAVTGGAVLLPDIQFKEASQYVPVDAGTYNLEARLAGTATVALTVPNVALRQGGIYTIFAFGLATGTPALSAEAAEDNAMARLRVLHASPDAPSVDIFVDGQMVLSDVPFGTLSEYLSLPAGQHNVVVTAVGSTTQVLSQTVDLQAMTDYTVAAAGELNPAVSALALPVFVDDNSRPADGQASVRFVHLSPNAPAVDVAVTGETPIFTDIDFLEASPYVDVAPGTYSFDVLETGTATVALNIPTVVLESNKVYTIFAIGLLAGTPELQALVSNDAAYVILYMPIIMNSPADPTP